MSVECRYIITMRIALAKDIKEYAEDFKAEFETYSKALNRQKHVPYVLEALKIDVGDIADNIECVDGDRESM